MIPPTVFEQTLRSFLAPVAPFLDDPRVSEIMINGPSEVFVERQGRIESTDCRFASGDALLGALRVIAQFAGRPFDDLHPILEARLPDGSRVEALIRPIAAEGPTLCIRRFSRESLTMDRLLDLGTLTPAAAEVLSVLVRAKQNLLVAGGTGSGKTSLLNALSSFIPDDERIVVIEDARELALQQRHVVPLETRPADAKGRGAVTVRDLFKASLRLRPDRIVLGEIRGGEALELIQAMTSGHGGCLSTVHATYPADSLHRLETMALMGGIELPLAALRAQIASAIDWIVQVARSRDGSRVVTHITEVAALDERAGYRLTDLFVRVRASSPRGTHAPAGVLAPTGAVPSCLEALEDAGLPLPAVIREAVRSHRRARGGAA